MKNIFKNLFTSKKKKQQAIDASYVELDKILKQKQAEREAALARKASTKAESKPTTKTKPVQVVTTTKSTAKKTTPKKK